MTASRGRGRPGTRFALGLALVAVAFPAGALAARLLLARAPGSLGPDFAAPLPVVTAWGTYGAWCFATLAGAVAVATAGLTLVLCATPERGVRFGGRLIATAAALALAGAACFPFTFSSDPYAYAAYGEMAARGLDPYRTVAPFIRGPAIDAARFQWGGAYPVCVYGPLFVAFARWAHAVAAPFGLAAELTFLRCAAALAFLGSIGLLAAALEELAPRRRFAILCGYGLHPVALWSVAEGHNDAFVLLAAAGAGSWSSEARGSGPGRCSHRARPSRLRAPCWRWVWRSKGGPSTAATPRRVRRGDRSRARDGAERPPMLPALVAVGSHGRYAPSVSLQSLLGLGPALGLSIAALAIGWFASRAGNGRASLGWAWPQPPRCPTSTRGTRSGSPRLRWRPVSEARASYSTA